MVRYPLVAAVLTILFGLAACCSAPKPATGQKRARYGRPFLPFFDPDINAVCDPPVGWNRKPKATPDHKDQVWLSPTGETAQASSISKGPCPSAGAWHSPDSYQMKKTEGDATHFTVTTIPIAGIRCIARGASMSLRKPAGVRLGRLGGVSGHAKIGADRPE